MAGLALVLGAAGVLLALQSWIESTRAAGAAVPIVPALLGGFLLVNLAGSAWIAFELGCGGDRLLRHPARRQAWSLQLVAANLMVPLTVYGLLADEQGGGESPSDMVFSVVGVVALVIGWRLWRRRQRHLAVGADEAMHADPRPPVLYLRSFQDDGQALVDEGRFGITRRAMNLLRLGTPEQEMAELLERIGPVVAIGKPGEPLPELGAARLYVSHDLWQARVIELMDRAALAVVRVGASPGVLWEIEQALRRLPRQRLVLALLGGSAVAPAVAERLAPVLGADASAVLSCAPPRWWHAFWRSPLRRIGALVCFDALGRPQVVPVRVFPLPWRDLLIAAAMRPAAGPLRHAWRQVFGRLGLAGEGRHELSRAVAVMLALLFGSFGAQWFYLGRTRRGVVYLLLLPVLLAPLFLSLADAVRFLWWDRAEFLQRCANPRLS